MPLLCDRPHARFVDFETSRFVVAIALIIGDRKLERGEEIPPGALDHYTLRCEYEMHRIELVSFAVTDPDLREACARNGVVLEDAAASQSPIQASQPVPLRKKVIILKK